MKFAAPTGNPAWGRSHFPVRRLKLPIEIAITRIPVANFMREGYELHRKTTTEDENAVGRNGITFIIGPDSKATQVGAENLNVCDEGTFKRVPAQK